MSGQAYISIAVGLAAAGEDLVRRQVSNWTCLAALVAGFVWNASDAGWRGAGASLLGTLCGFAVFLLFYLLGGMGGGDVKLMAGFGSILGAARILEAALWTAAAGGILAALVLAVRAVRSRIGAAKRGSEDNAIPYAPAIALGAWLSLVR